MRVLIWGLAGALSGAAAAAILTMAQGYGTYEFGDSLIGCAVVGLVFGLLAGGIHQSFRNQAPPS